MAAAWLDRMGSGTAALDRIGLGRPLRSLAGSAYGRALSDGSFAAPRDLRSSASGFGRDLGSSASGFGRDLGSFGGTPLGGRRIVDPTGGERQPRPWEQGGAAGSGGATMTPTGNALLDSTAGQYGVPPAVLAALVNRESSGNWAANNRVAYLRGERMLPYVGIFESTARSWGIDFDAMIGNQQAQLAAMAKIIAGIRQQHGYSDWGDAAAYYFAGPNVNVPGWTDENGMDAATYRSKFNAEVNQYAGGAYGAPDASGGAASGILAEAQQFVGTPYQWGGTAPGGFDCSGFVWYLDQKYGGGTIPQGSHYQYAWAQQNGRLYSDTSQLAPGDLIFLDTGWMAGGGSELNRAGHVGIYMGNGLVIQSATGGVGVVPLDRYLAQGQFLGAARTPWANAGTGGGGATYGTGSPYGGGYYQPTGRAGVDLVGGWLAAGTQRGR